MGTPESKESLGLIGRLIEWARGDTKTAFGQDFAAELTSRPSDAGVEPVTPIKITSKPPEAPAFPTPWESVNIDTPEKFNVDQIRAAFDRQCDDEEIKEASLKMPEVVSTYHNPRHDVGSGIMKVFEGEITPADEFDEESTGPGYICEICIKHIDDTEDGPIPNEQTIIDVRMTENGEVVCDFSGQTFRERDMPFKTELIDFIQKTITEAGNNSE